MVMVLFSRCVKNNVQSIFEKKKAQAERVKLSDCHSIVFLVDRLMLLLRPFSKEKSAL
jgi:hypothetical protein